MARFKPKTRQYPKEIEYLGLADVIARSRPREHAVCGIYFLLQGDQVVYVGQSRNLHHRLYQHHIRRRKEFDRYYLFPCPERLLSKLERHYIALFSPKYNKQPYVSRRDFLKSKDAALTEAEIRGANGTNGHLSQFVPRT